MAVPRLEGTPAGSGDPCCCGCEAPTLVVETQQASVSRACAQTSFFSGGQYYQTISTVAPNHRDPNVPNEQKWWKNETTIRQGHAGYPDFTGSMSREYKTCPEFAWITECSGSISWLGNPHYYCGGPYPFPDNPELEHITTRSEEYTLAMLEAEAAVELAEADIYDGSVDVAFRNLSNFTQDLTVRRSSYHFVFTPPSAASGLGYELEWVERFYPEGGGAPTDTPRSFVWSGASPGVDQSTPAYDVDPPATDGTISIQDVVVTCPEPEE